MPTFFGRLVRETGAKFLLHGTILTDIEETVAGIKRQHNILAQLGIDPEKEYGYKVLEPLQTLRKDGVRKVAKILGLPSELAKRIPFPGPALATRIVGEVTEERLEVVREATDIVEKELGKSKAFQYLAVLLMTRPLESGRTGGSSADHCCPMPQQRGCEDSNGHENPMDKLNRISKRITSIKGVNRCLYDLTPKPPATIEYI